jgi:hypothetical protein
LLVTANGAETLTGNVSKNYTDVSYFLEEEENIQEERSTAQNSQLNQANKNTVNSKEHKEKKSVVLENRTRDV